MKRTASGCSSYQLVILYSLLILTFFSFFFPFALPFISSSAILSSPLPSFCSCLLPSSSGPFFSGSQLLHLWKQDTRLCSTHRCPSSVGNLIIPARLTSTQQLLLRGLKDDCTLKVCALCIVSVELGLVDNWSPWLACKQQVAILNMSHTAVQGEQADWVIQCPGPAVVKSEMEGV